MMIPCPHCKAQINTKLPKPGKYTPKCPGCGKPFLLIVPEDANETVHVKRILLNPPTAPAPAGAGAAKPSAKSAPKSGATAKTGPASGVGPKSNVKTSESPGAARKPAVPNTVPASASPEVTGEFTSPSALDDDDELDSDSPTQAVGEATGDFSPRAEVGEATAEVTGAFHSTANAGTEDEEESEVSHSNEATEATGGYIAKQDIDSTAAHTESGAASEAPSAATATDDTEGEAQPKKKGKKKKKGASGDPDLPEQLGGYAIRKQLGKGGMGAVYLAQQVSLDRPVALKVMNPQWAEDPIFLARFVREAYAAAQLNHHNVVSIYDIGEASGINFFSMEFVEGKSLGDVLRKNGSLEPAVAVAYILQAARGLKFAHDRGMVHRDVKPDNLMLNSEGMVKVADLGLVKTKGMTAEDDRPPEESAAGNTSISKIKSTASADVTTAGTAMGSPSYMAPEQCRDAATVDQRADVYSLGCSLYALLAGRAPFTGETAVEVMSKHLTEPPPPLSTVVKGLPKGISELVDKSLKKDPLERYQSMDEFIAAMKEWQDDQKSGPPRPTEEQILAFEGLSSAMTNIPSGKLASTLAVVMPLAALVAAGGLLVFMPVVSVAIVLGVMAAIVSGFVTAGTLTGSHLFLKFREWAFGSRFVDWLTVGASVMLFVAIVFLTGLIGPALVAALVGSLIGAGFAFALVRPAASQRYAIKSEMDGVLKRLRIAGIEEDAVRKFVIDAAGDDWPDVYEALFGYPAMTEARTEHGAKKKLKWRDKLILKFEGMIQTRNAARDKKRLQKLEMNRLKAEGLDPAEARSRAEDAAEDLVEQAGEIRKANADKQKKVNVREVLTRYDRAKLNQIKRPKKSFLQKLPAKIIGTIFSPKLRMLAGAVLILGGLMWLRQNETQMLQRGTGDADQQVLALGQRLWTPPLGVKPLAAPLPEPVTSLFDSVNPMVAGVILILSTFGGGTFAVLFTMLCAILVVTGHKLAAMFGIPIPDPGIGFNPQQVMLVVGGGLGILTALLARGR